MPAMLSALVHIFMRVFVRSYTFLGTSPGGIAAQIITLIGTEVQGGWWRLEAWRKSWQGGLKRGGIALVCVWSAVFLISVATTVYDDHMGLVNAVSRISLERDQVKAKSSQQEQEIATLKSRPPQIVYRNTTSAPASYSDAVETLASFIEEASQIQARFVATNDTKKELEEANAWASKVNEYLSKRLGNSYAIQFRTAVGSASMGMPVNHSIEGGNYWQDIEGKKSCLNGFIQQLRSAK